MPPYAYAPYAAAYVAYMLEAGTDLLHACAYAVRTDSTELCIPRKDHVVSSGYWLNIVYRPMSQRHQE